MSNIRVLHACRGTVSGFQNMNLVKVRLCIEVDVILPFTVFLEKPERGRGIELQLCQREDGFKFHRVINAS